MTMIEEREYTSKELENWADKLLEEYDRSLSDLRAQQKITAAQDKRLRDSDEPVFSKPLQDKKSILNSMENSMVFAMDWMEKGRNPDLQRGADKHAVYQRQFFESLDVIPDIAEQIYDINTKELHLTELEKKQLAKIFASWSRRERDCFIARTVEQKTFQQIADEIGVGRSTVQSYVERAKRKMTEALQHSRAKRFS